MLVLSETALPAYCRHKASGKAYVTLSGSMIYLGDYGSVSSKREYERRLAEWLAAGRRLPVDPQEATVAEVGALLMRRSRDLFEP